MLSWTETTIQDQPDRVTRRSSAQRQDRTLTVKALKYDIAPAKTGYRVFSEIAIGDCIIDFVTPLVRVTDVGDTPLVHGTVITEYTLNQANRETAGLTALAIKVDLNTLKDLAATIDGIRWVQKEIGGDLAKSWSCELGGRQLSQSLLFRRAT